MTSVTIRACTEADWPTILRVDQLAFGYTFDEEEGAAERAVLEPERSLLAYVDGAAVGHTTAYTLAMSVPGGSDVPFAGITWVGVLPTHRRRGVLTALLERQLDDIQAHGEPIAALHAAEPAIYGRFGFGLASRKVSLTIPTSGVGVTGPEDHTLRTRLVDVAAARAPIEQVYEATRRLRAGMPGRSEEWWQRCTTDVKSQRGGFSELRCLLVEDAEGRPRAYAIHAVRAGWENALSTGHLRVREHGALDAAAAATLWRVLVSTDLVVTVGHDNVPVDDPVLAFLDNPRRAQPLLGDSVYVRLVDLPAALSAREYARSFDGVVEVRDAMAARNDGRWRLSLGPRGADCSRTEAEPDVRLDVGELGGAYLGGASLVARSLAGAVEERTPGALAELSAAFWHEPAPYSPFSY